MRPHSFALITLELSYTLKDISETQPMQPAVARLLIEAGKRNCFTPSGTSLFANYTQLFLNFKVSELEWKCLKEHLCWELAQLLRSSEERFIQLPAPVKTGW